MGADIHAFVEFKEKNVKYDYWDCFGDEINLGRNYDMFGYLTDGLVRSSEVLKCGIEPRGLPEGKLSWDVMRRARLKITEDGCGENEVTLEKAKKWGVKIYNDSNGNPCEVDHPDWHNHSWLSYKELKAILSEIRRKRIGVGTAYKAVLAVMKTYEDDKYDTRLVFWFDN